MTDLMELAARVEALDGGDREIDAEIACAIGRPLGNIDHWLHGDDITYRPTAYGYYVAVLPNGETSEGFASREFTASLDAAMTLVPKNFGVRLDLIGGSPSSARAIVGGRMGDWPMCVSLPIALTAACLRARAEKGE